MKQQTLIVILLILILIGLNVYGITKNAIASDEHAYIYTGYTEYTIRDVIVRKEYVHGLFVPVFNTFPLLFLDLKSPENHTELTTLSMYDADQKFLYELNGDKFQQLLIWSRIGTLIISVLFALSIYMWARGLFDERAAIIALCLYIFNPVILSVSTIIGKDLQVAFFVFISFYFLWRYYQDHKLKDLLLCGLMVGLAQITDYPAVFIYPIMGLVMIISLAIDKSKIPLFGRIKRTTLHFLVIVGISYLVILLTFALSTYGISGLFRPFEYSVQHDPALNYGDYQGAIGQKPMYHWLAQNIPLPLPYYYLKGFAVNIFSSGYQKGGTYLINGETKIVWYYFLISYLLKTPIAAILLFVLGCVSCLTYLMAGKRWRDFLFLWLPIVIYNLIFALTTKQFGFKYILPVIPFMILISCNIRIIKNRKKLAPVFTIILLAWCALSTVLIAPFYGSYFNELIGGSKNGYKYFTSTNVDAGQELYLLKDYLSDNSITDFRFKFYGYPTLWSHSLPEVYGIPYQELGCGPQTGLMVISATEMMGNRTCYGWLWDLKPAKRIGYSLFVYNITEG